MAAQLLPLLVRLRLVHALLDGATPTPPSSSSASASAAPSSSSALHGAAERYSALPAGGAPSAALELADDLCAALGVGSVRGLLRHGAAHLAGLGGAAPGGALAPAGAAQLVRWTGHLAWAWSLPWRRAGGAVAGPSSAAVGAPSSAGVRLWPGAGSSSLGLGRLLPGPPSLIPLPATFQELLLRLSDKVRA